MKGEQQEERIPNFIGNAVIILTAAHLGCEVGMLATAQEGKYPFYYIFFRGIRKYMG